MLIKLNILSCVVLFSLFLYTSCDKRNEPSGDPDSPEDTTGVLTNLPLAKFTISNNQCVPVCEVAFTNNSLHSDTYSWDFGDGTVSSAEANPSHYYTKTGTFQVILTASKSGRLEYDKDTQIVEIVRPPYAIGTSKNEYGTGLVQTSDGGYVVVGRREINGASYNVYLFKTDSNRKIVWEKDFGGAGYQEANAIRQTTDGGYVIVGNSTDAESGFNDVYVIKTDSDGNSIWEKKISSPSKRSGQDILQTTDNGFIIAGTSNNPGNTGNSDALLLLKIDFQGNLLWEKTLGSSASDGGFTISEAADGNILVGGFYDFQLSGTKPYLIKMDPSGEVLWERYDAGYLLFATAVQKTSDGGIIWGGMDSYSTGNWRGAVTKTDANGVVEWTTRFPGTGTYFNSIECIRPTSDGGYIMCGQSDESGMSYPVRRHIVVRKLDVQGNKLWEKQYFAGGRVGNAYDIQQTPNGGYVLVGYMLIEPLSDPTPSFFDYDVYLLKLDPNGELQ